MAVSNSSFLDGLDVVDILLRPWRPCLYGILEVASYVCLIKSDVVVFIAVCKATEKNPKCFVCFLDGLSNVEACLILITN